MWHRKTYITSITTGKIMDAIERIERAEEELREAKRELELEDNKFYPIIKGWSQCNDAEIIVYDTSINRIRVSLTVHPLHSYYKGYKTLPMMYSLGYHLIAIERLEPSNHYYLDFERN